MHSCLVQHRPIRFFSSHVIKIKCIKSSKGKGPKSPLSTRKKWLKGPLSTSVGALERKITIKPPYELRSIKCA